MAAAARRVHGGVRRARADEWAEIFAAVDACVSPVLDLAEAPLGDQLHARGTFTERFGVVQPEPAPRLSRTPGSIGTAPTAPGADGAAVLGAWGFGADEIDALVTRGVLAVPS